MGGQLLQNSASQVERHAPMLVNEAMKAMLDYFDGSGMSYIGKTVSIVANDVSVGQWRGESISGVKAERSGS